MHLYLDNFRGFSDTCLPLTDVNFLVGENSTGKTSVLGLIHLISTSEFWFHQTFDVGDVKFGHFRDIVSVHTDDSRFFRIGLTQLTETHQGARSKTKKSIRHAEGFLATYREHQGLPRLARFTYSDGKSQYTMKFTKSGIWYKCDAVLDVSKNKLMPTKTFENWADEHQYGKAGYRRLSPTESIRVGPNLPLPFTLALIRNTSKLEEGSIKSERDRLSLPLDFPSSIHNVVWMAPIRTQPRRTYDEVKLDYSPEGTHTPYVIRRILDTKKEAEQFLSFIGGIGKSSGLFETISIKRFGKSITAPFEVDIVLDEKELNLSNVGYGVSQSLPVIVELFIRPKGTWFAIQQPEVHLHPRAQASLGDMFYNLAVREQKCFFVETHSDFTIDRFRTNYRRGQRKRPNAQVIFFERKNGQNIVSSLPIGSKGELPHKQPESYRAFFLKEQYRTLGI